MRDLRIGRAFSFEELAAEAERFPGTEHWIRFPSGAGVEFVLETLAAWRLGQVVCPLETGQRTPSFATRPPERILHLKTTSATTSAPRFVAFREAQLAADVENIVTTMGLRAEWPNIGVISLAHSYGFSSLVLPLLLHGIPLVLGGSALPEALRVAAATERTVTLPAVPALWRTWHDADAIPPNVMLAISAGAPLPLSLEQLVFDERGLKIHNFYGSSECGGIAYDATAVPRSDGALAGTPLRNVDVHTGADGCLVVKGGAVGETYWPECSPALAQHVFRTSDLAEVTSKGILLRGRATDQINVAGRKVLPEAVETVIGGYPGVRACVVFGIPAPESERGEWVVACLSREKHVPTQSIKDYAATHLPTWQLPREWWFVDELASNARGKLSRSQWRARYLKVRRQAGTGRSRL